MDKIGYNQHWEYVIHDKVNKVGFDTLDVGSFVSKKKILSKKKVKENDIVPKKFIMFTDGYPWDSWGDEDYCDTIFIVHSYHDKNMQAPFGVTAHYEKGK